MRQYISEEEAMYNDMYHGLFSRKLARWAIENMEVEDPTTGKMKRVPMHSSEEVMETLRSHNVKIREEYIYTAWYLFMMAIADYPKTLLTDAQRTSFVEETLCDPDGCPESVLSCFVAKMCDKGIPIYWERFI